MTDEIAENMVDIIIELRRNGIKDDNSIVHELMKKFDGDEDAFIGQLK